MKSCVLNPVTRLTLMVYRKQDIAYFRVDGYVSYAHLPTSECVAEAIL